MADYDTLHSSTEQSRPIELYEITKGSAVYRYANTQDTITVGGLDFQPIAISRGRIGIGADAQTSTLTITLPGSLPLPQEFIIVPPAEQVRVNIYRYERDETPSFNTQVQLFEGYLEECGWTKNGAEAELICKSIESLLGQNIPRFRFTSACNHIVYDDACGVSAALHSHLGTITAISGNTATIDGLSASGIDATGGYMTTGGSSDFRMVLSQSGDVVTLPLPFAADPTGTNGQVFRGCDHDIHGDCALTFDNVANYGGFAFVPKRNPLQQGWK